MQITENQRLKFLMKELGYLTQGSFAQAIGIKQGSLSDILRQKEGVKVSDAIKYKLEILYNINRNWLETGNGEMFLNPPPKTLKEQQEKEKFNPITESGKMVPFYEADAIAGNEYNMEMSPTVQSGMINIGTLLKDSENAIRVYGNSMVPNYPAGCVIGVKLHTDSFIEPGRVYVLETRDNRYLKRLYYNEDRTAFHCLSDNLMKYEEGPRRGKYIYQDFEIPLNEVIRLHRVIGVIKRNSM